MSPDRPTYRDAVRQADLVTNLLLEVGMLRSGQALDVTETGGKSYPYCLAVTYDDGRRIERSFSPAGGPRAMVEQLAIWRDVALLAKREDDE